MTGQLKDLVVKHLLALKYQGESSTIKVSSREEREEVFDYIKRICRCFPRDDEEPIFSSYVASPCMGYCIYMSDGYVKVEVEKPKETRPTVLVCHLSDSLLPEDEVTLLIRRNNKNFLREVIMEDIKYPD